MQLLKELQFEDEIISGLVGFEPITFTISVKRFNTELQGRMEAWSITISQRLI